MNSALRQSRSQRGNSIVEMLLFTPLALLLLFSATDAGLAFRDKAAVVDAVRSGLLTAPVFATAEPLLAAGVDAEDQLNESQAELLLTGVVRTIARNILLARGDDPDSNPDDFQVTADIVLVHLDPESGNYISHELFRPAVTFPAHGPFDIRREFPSYPHIPLSGYIDSELASETSRSPCSLAVPLAAPAGGTGHRSFDSAAALLAVEVTGLTRGISRKAAYSPVERLYALEEHQIVPLRAQQR